MTDPIADMIIRIKNALLAGHTSVVVPHSRLKAAIATILKTEGYIADVTVEETKPQASLIVSLKYVGKTPAITDVKRVSKPGRRTYASAHSMPKTLGGYGITIVSTSQGVMTETTARKKNIGGEVICQIW
jgi:small subunit ribosomal protein S8